MIWEKRGRTLYGRDGDYQYMVNNTADGWVARVCIFGDMHWDTIGYAPNERYARTLAEEDALTHAPKRGVRAD